MKAKVLTVDDELMRVSCYSSDWIGTNIDEDKVGHKEGLMSGGLLYL